MSFFQFMQWAFRDVPSAMLSLIILCTLVQGAVAIMTALVAIVARNTES